jgi:DNA (cytosine-5)-methyltransferase 1
MTRAGVDVVSYSELKAYIQNTHEANFPNSTLLGGDITKVTDDSLRQLETQDIDMVFAGFPCQGFSNAGKKLPDDPRNTLFREFVRCTGILNPNVIIGENVKGLLSRKTAEGRSYIDVIVESFENMGYSVIFKVCKAHLYGVPQKRERLIIVGVKRTKLEDFNLSFPPEDAVELAPNLKNIVSFGMTGTIEVPMEWFEGIPEECVLTDMENEEGAHGAHPYLLSKVAAAGDQLSYAGKTYTMLFSFGKRISPIHCEIVDIRLPAKTIICTFEHQPRLFLPIRNKNGYYLRCMSPDELKQIQGFPADYQVTGSVKEQIIQIGNAVPPPLIEKIVRHVCNVAKV